ncbi:MAG: TonB-dependent receptor plug domain-containing protein [Flavobacteriaceae bacterium]|nr:TonB-dependent receptor plug domain-containing protein [Flavobacteriaceae bacterium]
MTLLSQQNNSQLSGVVTSKDAPLQNIAVYIENTTYSTETDAEGKYVLALPPGKYNITSGGQGYKRRTFAIELKEEENKKLNIELSENSPKELEEVIVVGKSAIQEVRESAYNVVALDAKSLYNSTLDLGHMLDKASGVKIRETGGVGSNMSISLNGFTGRHIKLFMDGVPMAGFGSAFQLNNIPVGVASRIEVYKGVVPIEFGADAIGGAINIVTNQTSNTFLDASYSYGSFNTHKSNVSLGHTTKSGFTVQLNAFQNYSDNSYKVKAPILDLKTSVMDPTKEHWVKRFHDTYHNETIMLKIGFVNKSWADRLLFGITLGKEYADIQHANEMKIVYGKRYRTGSTILPSLTYEKKNLVVKDLNLRFTANYNRNYNRNYDTANRKYNWLGDYVETNHLGESQYSLAKFYNDNFSSTTNLSYAVNEKHTFFINNVLTGYERKNNDKVAVAEIGSTLDTMRRANLKDILGLSYRYRHNDKWNTNLFGKYYYQKVIGPVDVSTVTGHTKYEERTKTFKTKGMGLATTYFLKDIQFKASVEKAYRMPTDTELFGDEVTERGNSSLKGENSMNYNLGVTMNKQLTKHTFYVDVNLYYRDTKDYIMRLVEQRYGNGEYINHGKVQNKGIDAEIRYYYKNKFMLGGNVTYQDMRDKERYEASSTKSSKPSLTYNDKMKNVPYFFGNAEAAYYMHDLWGKSNVLSLGYNFNFMHQFYLQWPSLGSKETKSVIPHQLSHDISLTYSLKNGRYNVSVEARNLTNTLLYDNYGLQKPGRSFSIKLRYFFMKRHNKSNRNRNETTQTEETTQPEEK